MAGASKRIPSEIAGFRGKEIVVDTDSGFIYIGKLLSVTRRFFVLADADVHDRSASSSILEKYLLDCKRLGIRSNRKNVHVRLERIVSFSLLEDIVDY